MQESILSCIHKQKEGKDSKEMHYTGTLYCVLGQCADFTAAKSAVEHEDGAQCNFRGNLDGSLNKQRYILRFNHVYFIHSLFLRKNNPSFIDLLVSITLVGTSKFAKSYVTSEYLFRIFKDGIPFDYTSVVAGYIKAVEQLSESLIYDVIAQEHNENLFIQRDKISMGQMFYFFEVNQDNLFCIDTEISTPKIIECMNNYLEFDRNGYFHKHNISRFKVAERIRNNTQLILYWLLGGMKLSDNQESINESLGIIDDRFERLFKKIAYRRSFKYELSFGNDIWKKVVRVRKKQEYKYDEDGYIADAELRFLQALSHGFALEE